MTISCDAREEMDTHNFYMSIREWSNVLDSMKSLKDITEICETSPSFSLDESLEIVRELRDHFIHPPDRWPLLVTINPALYDEKEMKHVRTVAYHLRSLCVSGDTSIESHLGHTKCKSILFSYIITLLPLSISLEEKWWFNAIIHIAYLLSRGTEISIDFFIPWRVLLTILEESSNEQYGEIVQFLSCIVSLDINEYKNCGNDGMNALREALESIVL